MKPGRQPRGPKLNRLARAIERGGGVKLVAKRANIAWQHLDNVLANRRPLGLLAFRRLRRVVDLPPAVWLEILDPATSLPQGEAQA